MSKIRLQVMGSPRIWVGENEVTKEMSKKSMAILIYLLFSPEQRITRERIMNLLWCESDQKAARYNLRHNLWNIRRTVRMNNLKIEWLDSDNHIIEVIDKDILEIDALKLEEIKRIGESSNWNMSDEEIKSAIDLYEDNFLERFYLSDCEEYNDWLYFKREEFQRLYIEILANLAKSCDENQRTVMAINLYKKLISFMPYDDDIVLKLVKNLYDDGDYFNGLRYYERHKKQLRDDLNIAPGKKLQELAELIKEKNDNILLTKKKSENIITINDYPLMDVNYMTLSFVIDKILEQSSEEKIKEFDAFYWFDLTKINGNIRKTIDTSEIKQEFLTESTEKIRIFKAMYNLLIHFNKNGNLIIEFVKDQRMDNYSVEFFENLYKTDKGNMMKNWL